MGSLIYGISTSLDGYVNDARGSIDWTAPDEELHRVFNDLERNVDTYLFGRRMYETMRMWDTLDDDTPVMQEYAAVWQGIDKIIYSTTLDSVATARTRLERSFDVDSVRAMKEADGVLSIGGPTLAAHALRAGLVDELRQFVVPVVLGGGTRWLPDDIARIDLELLDERRFATGVVALHYRVKR